MSCGVMESAVLYQTCKIKVAQLSYRPLSRLFEILIETRGHSAVFQITFKGRVSTRSSEGSIDVGLPISSQVYHLFCRVRWPAVLGF